MPLGNIFFKIKHFNVTKGKGIGNGNCAKLTEFWQSGNLNEGNHHPTSSSSI
jgi:hypothetical protein